MIFPRTVRYKSTGHLFYRRIRRVAFLDTVTIRGVPCYECTRADGTAAAFIPVEDTVLHIGKKVKVVFEEPPHDA